MLVSAAAGSGGLRRAKNTVGSTEVDDKSPHRRSANYQPPNWDFDDVQSLRNDYAEERYTNRSNELKEQVKMMLDQELELLSQLELIDNLQRLGLSYHFEDKIHSVLGEIYHQNHMINIPNQKGLYETALEFRLLRKYGFDVSQESFDGFKDERGDLKASLSDDVKGMLYLYEASYLLTENESNLELAREFTAKHLKQLLADQKRMHQEIVALVRHALELPLHWRVAPVEVRWFIDEYEKRPDMNPILLELAKLNFNIVQATYQNDLKYMSRWWKSTCLAEKLNFARDRLVESFAWAVGGISDPQHGYCRRMMTKILALITTVDDIYDVYGTLNELELFTDAVQRWDIQGVDQLPDYMRLCYLSLYNSINQMAYDVMKEQDVHIIPYLRKSWADLCKSYLKEAKWYFSGYVPTLEEYMNNAWISMGSFPVLVHAYVIVHNPIKEEDLERHQFQNIARCVGIITRIANDLGTSRDELQRGDVSKSIQCYMKQTGSSEENAREYMKVLKSETWKQMNELSLASSPFSPTFIGIAMNLARMAQCMYEHGDGFGHQNAETRNRFSKLLFDSICLP